MKDIVSYMLKEKDSNAQIDPSMIAQTLIRKSDLRSGIIPMRKRDQKGHDKDQVGGVSDKE